MNLKRELHRGLQEALNLNEPFIDAILEQFAVTDRRQFLKVKLKCLAQEAHFIRELELKNRHRPDLRNELAVHRRGVVRSAARSTGLAYGFIRGRAYRRIEARCHRAPNWKEVERMVNKYGDRPFEKSWYET